MIDSTINVDKTLAASGEGAILAGRYQRFCQMGLDGAYMEMV